MINFVTAVVLQIKDVLAIAGRSVPSDRAVRFVRDRVCVLAIGRARPDVEYAILVRRQPGELRTVGRDLWIGAHRISKENFARDQRRKLCGRGHYP